uniref:Uncharacterized protein n=1 Tax=Ascaris lumbricoides TaxID=6252 RepID=A0A9J2Q3T7_ASCLU
MSAHSPSNCSTLFAVPLYPAGLYSVVLRSRIHFCVTGYLAPQPTSVSLM